MDHITITYGSTRDLEDGMHTHVLPHFLLTCTYTHNYTKYMLQFIAGVMVKCIVHDMRRLCVCIHPCPNLDISLKMRSRGLQHYTQNR